MLRVLFLSDRGPDEVLPAVRGLGADAKAEPLSLDALTRIPDLGLTLVIADCVRDPQGAIGLLQTFAAARIQVPVVAVVSPADIDRFPWADLCDDFVVDGAREAESVLRLTMLMARHGEQGEGVVRLGPVAINVDTYRVTAGGPPLDLTYKEFELLRFLAERPGRVFTRAQLLQEVWGYDFYGGTRTVDVHVRRLRAKLGPEHEHLIETVRGVGYRAAQGD